MRVLLSSLVLGLFAAWPAPHQDSEPRSLLESVPRESAMMISVAEIASLRADLGRNAWVRMLGDDEVAPLWDWVKDQEEWKELAESADVPISPFELISSLHGSVVGFMAVSESGVAGGGVLIEPGPDRSEFDEHVDLLFEHRSQGRVVTYETYQDVELTLFETEGDAAEQAAELGIFFEVDGITGVVGSVGRDYALELCHSVIDRRLGAVDPPGLIDEPLLLEARGGRAPARVEFFVDTNRMVDAFPEEARVSDESTKELVDLLGVSGLSWVHAEWEPGTGERSDLSLRVRLPTEAYIGEFLAHLTPAPVEVGRLLPFDSTRIGLYGLDVWEIYRSVWDLVAELSPDDYEQARAQLDMMGQSMGGVDIEEDFLAQLSGQFASFSAPVPEAEWLLVDGDALGFEAGQVPEELLQGSAYVIGLRDTELVELFFEEVSTFAGMLGIFDPSMIETEEFQGTTISMLELPSEVMASWCFSDDIVVFSFYPSLVRAVLRQQGSEDAPSALDSERFKPFIEQYRAASGLTLSSTRHDLKLVLEVLGQVQAMIAVEPDAEQLGFDNEALLEPFGWAADIPPLPSSELVDRYFEGTSILVIAVEQDALVVRFSTR